MSSFKRTLGSRFLGVATAMPLALALTATGCGDGQENAATDDRARPEVSRPVGKPLPQDLYGAWIGRSSHEHNFGRLSLLPPDHRFCREMVRTRGSCFLTEAMEGGAALDLDSRGQPRLIGYGEAGARDGEVVFRILSDPLERCVGTSHRARLEARGNWLQLTPTTDDCYGDDPRPMRMRSTYDRV